MRAIDDILRRAKKLAPKERRRLVNALNALDRATESRAQRSRVGQRSKTRVGQDLWRSLAGTGRSKFTDVSRDKYKHLADVYADQHRTE